MFILFKSGGHSVSWDRSCLNEKPESTRLLTCVISTPAFAFLPLMSIVLVDIHLREVDILDVDESTGVCPVKFCLCQCHRRDS